MYLSEYAGWYMKETNINKEWLDKENKSKQEVDKKPLDLEQRPVFFEECDDPTCFHTEPHLKH